MLVQKLPLDLMQTQWASELNPIIANPSTNPVHLKNIALAAGVNIINHKLSRPLVGWKTTRVRAAATIYDTQDNNQTPQLTLLLVASAPVVIDLEVF